MKDILQPYQKEFLEILDKHSFSDYLVLAPRGLGKVAFIKQQTEASDV